MKRLDAYRAFPIVAWVLVLGFAFYVYTLTTVLETATPALAEEAMLHEVAE